MLIKNLMDFELRRKKHKKNFYQKVRKIKDPKPIQNRIQLLLQG